MKYKHDGPKIPKPISTTWAINGTIPDFNPPGDTPELNPKEYINPLTGRDSSGPFDFS